MEFVDEKLKKSVCSLCCEEQAITSQHGFFDIHIRIECPFGPV